ncbi:hypothetical protein AGLY_011719 [Aphis glycines]|uniref:GH18 domain-containing protein n=1 Tax=Aphis glycines TaxID=307491 RepID=A0A6G0TB03_APHGL|nr:hypothetical protein AGLY_011719 [Aphis glycines]
MSSSNSYVNIGSSACGYNGETDTSGKKCQNQPVKLEYIPEECTSLFYEGITIDNDLNISPTNKETDKKRITMLVKGTRPVVLYYSRTNGIKGWFEAVDPSKIDSEIQKLKVFVNENPIAGLVLKGIDYRFGLIPENEIPQNYSEKISKYLRVIRDQFPSLQIGMYLEAKSLIHYGEQKSIRDGGCSKTPTDFTDWFSFEILNNVVDFYLFGFEEFNECNSKFLKGGITPLVTPDPKDPNINTLVRFTIALKEAPIPKTKTYLEYLIKPSLKKQDELIFRGCERSYNEYCENPDYKNLWCVDNQDSFYEKGQFAVTYARGFVAKDIDLVDRDNKCECNDDKFITFHMVLSGYNGNPMITCSKISGS